MINLLTIIDPHFSGIGPRAYMGSYKNDLLTLLAECAGLAREHSCSAVLIPGDLTHSHIMSTAVLTELVEALREFPCPVLTVAGNHDRESSSLEDLRAAPYGVLQAAGVIRDLWDMPWSTLDAETGNRVHVNGYSYDENTDRDINQYLGLVGRYEIRDDVKDALTFIHLTHGMLLPEAPHWARAAPEARYTTFDQLRQIPASQRPHILINGHLHDGHPPTFIDEKTLVVNPGSIARLTRGVEEINRTLKVGLIKIESPQKYWCEEIELKSQRPGVECLDREELVRETERQKNRAKMEEYLSLLGTRREVRVRDARAVVDEAVKELGLSAVVRDRCLARLDAVAKRMEEAG